jgi:hypothetical protein
MEQLAPRHDPVEAGSRSPWTPLWWALAFLVSIAATAGLFIGLYAERDVATPVGYDTPTYIWRAKLASGDGIEAIGSVGAAGANPYRPGFPVFAAVLDGTTGIDPLDLALLLPAIFAAVTGLAAGAIAQGALGQPVWAFPVVAIAVGTSINLSLTSVGYVDNLILGALVLGIAAVVLARPDSPRSWAASGLLISAAACIHLFLTGAFLGILGLLALLLLPVSWKDAHRGIPLHRTQSAQVGAIAIGGVFLGAAVYALMLPAHPDRFPGHVFEFRRKLRNNLPFYHLPAQLPVAAVGAAGLVPDRAPARRRGLLFLVAWVAVAGLSVVALRFGILSAAHRMLGFALALPILGAIGLVTITRSLGRFLGVAGSILGAVITVGGLVVGAVWGWAGWERVHTFTSPVALAEAETAGQYLEDVGNDRPVVFAVDPRVPVTVDPRAPYVRRQVRLIDRNIRAGLPPSQIALARLYLGDWRAALDGRITLRGLLPFDEVSRTHYRRVRPFLDDDPIVLVLHTYNRRGLPLPPTPVGLGVSLARGPEPPSLVDPPPPSTPPTAGWLIVRVGLLLGLLTVVGLGWSLSLVPGGMVERAALAPTLGVAVIVVAGVAVDRVGPAVGGGVGMVVTLAAAAVGWGIVAAPWMARRRSRATALPAPEPDAPADAGP